VHRCGNTTEKLSPMTHVTLKHYCCVITVGELLLTLKVGVKRLLSKNYLL
jgi:hypothetical protein